MNLLKPENFSPLLALIGIVLIMGSKKQRRRDIGRIMVGFAILMYGMELMKDAVSPLADMSPVLQHPHRLQQSPAGRAGGCRLHRRHPVLRRLRGHPAGPGPHRFHHLRHGHPHHHGPEHRHLRHRPV